MQLSRSATKHDNFFCQGVIISSGLTLGFFFPSNYGVLREGGKPSRCEGTMPEPWQYPDMSQCLECNEDIVMLFVNEKHHNVLLWSENVPRRCSSSTSSNGAPQRYRAVLWLWDKITRKPKKKKVTEKRRSGGHGERGGGEGWANCAQSPWQPLYHAAAVPAANISRLTQPRTFPPQRNTHTVMYKHVRLFNRALCVCVHVEICTVCQC